MTMGVQFSAKKHSASFLKITQQAQGSGVCTDVVFAMSIAIHIKKSFRPVMSGQKPMTIRGWFSPPKKCWGILKVAPPAQSDVKSVGTTFQMSKAIPKKMFPTISYGRAKTHDIKGLVLDQKGCCEHFKGSTMSADVGQVRWCGF
jgi:hypothetical protein